MTLVFPVPPITTSSAHGLTLLFAFCYVGSLYISKNARLSFAEKQTAAYNGKPRPKYSDERWRDDPDVIRARLVAVSIATSICCGIVFLLLRHFVGDRPDGFEMALDTTIARLGFRIYFDSDMIFPHLVTPVLFLGPLYAGYLGGHLPLQRNWSFKTDVISKFISWQGVRNYLMAPITEELVFRACVLAVYHMSGASTRRMIFLGPLSFGLAHVHHAWDTFNRYGGTAAAAKRAIIMSLFQLAYTALFGFHCSYLFLRTGSIFPSISAHIFCNIMGVPEIAWHLKVYPQRRKAILFMYVLGVVGFAYVLEPWTRTGGVLYWRDQKPGAGIGSY
ncbi:putative CAAX prenyl protease 2 [Hypsizygus marmoreus]|uniref:intramembrane prenyl-peptidase Rce1 n=1 Tax=Hypsizygus marmoreus TaxID=39966 RepID=A0A369J701_HYPMA|nr:putative CAAX prenyl protease 2 [Hypsizygus marmoreus]